MLIIDQYNVFLFVFVWFFVLQVTNAGCTLLGVLVKAFVGFVVFFLFLSFPYSFSLSFNICFSENIAFDSQLWLFLWLFLVFHYHSINNNNKNVINGVAVVAACAALIRQLRLAPGHTSSTSSSSDADVFISLCYLSNAITAIASCARTPQPQPFIDPIYDDKAGPIDKGNNNELLWAAAARHPLWVIVCV